jgi:DNA polymerase I-like protein with 3'-5' exonuclease and polymerase domains
MTGARFNFYGDIKVPVVYNFPIQSLVAWRVKKAMKDIDARLNWETEFILMQIHDDIVLEGRSWARLARILKQEMEKPVLINGVNFSFTVEIKIGTNWAHLVKLPEVMKVCQSKSP